MKTYKQYYKEQGPYHNRQSGGFQQKRYDKDAVSLVRQAEEAISKMDDRSADEIRQDVIELLFKIKHLYSAAEDESTPSKGKLADTRTQIVKRAREIPGTLPTYAEARQFLLDVKVIINEGSTDI
jgi:hypothetical protein